MSSRVNNNNSNIIVYKESLEHGPLPKRDRKIRNEVFLAALPPFLPHDLARWMCKKYVDKEPCEIGITFSDLKKNKYGFARPGDYPEVCCRSPDM